MDKTAIKTFAINSRNKLMEDVEYKMSLVGITENEIKNPISSADGIETYQFGSSTNNIYDEDIEKREFLVKEVKQKGFKNVVEEVAFTWFNRIIAIRFLEVNNYLPTRTRVLSSEISGKIEPDIITEAFDIDLDYSNEDKELIFKLKDENKLDELFRFLFIKQCNKLNEILPGLFEKTDDYLELLLNISFTNEDGVVRQLINSIPEDDFKNQVEIIGWLYQFYNSELKDETFANLKKRIKINKERIPAATQLFTPDWIVKYMVENSLGRLWLEGHPNAELENKWQYHVKEAKQEPEVESKLINIKNESKILRPEDIKVIDPCMGSGHILVYIFDVLMDIYVSEGYTEKDSAELILKNNLFGLDIDDRAYQLAYFAVMMKARSYNRKILTKDIKPQISSIKESNSISDELIQLLTSKNSKIKNPLINVIDTFKDGKNYGSILNVSIDGLGDIEKTLINLLDNKEDLIYFKYQNELETLLNILQNAKFLSQKYNVVVTNPPYMGNSGMNPDLKEYIKKNYPLSKSDLFAVFIEKCAKLTNDSKYFSMITQQSWMYLSSFVDLRKKLLNLNILNILHLGPRTFEELSGEVVQSCSFVIRKSNLQDYHPLIIDLKNFDNSISKRDALINNNFNHYNQLTQENYLSFPNYIFMYKVPIDTINIYTKGNLIEDSFSVKRGPSLSSSTKFLRYWFEVNAQDISFKESQKNKWDLCVRNGSKTKWYLNVDEIIYSEILKDISNYDYQNQLGVVWPDSRFGSELISARIKKPIYSFESGNNLIETDNMDNVYSLLALFNSYLYETMLSNIVNGQHFSPIYIKKLPYVKLDNDSINNVKMILSELNKFNSFFELSYHFEKFCSNSFNKIEDYYNFLLNSIEDIISNVLKLEDEINISIENKTGIPNEIHSSNKCRLLMCSMSEEVFVKSFISYSVGCMFGRYSVDKEGLQFAGGEFKINNYHKFIPDEDNIIPVLDSEYFEDDIVGRFVEFVKTCFGQENLEENLDFIANVLSKNKKSSREKIRDYLLKNFFNDHKKTYKKCPIYWQFSSGKENGFNCLVYMHRYDPSLVARIRTDYLHKTQKAIEQRIATCDNIINHSSSNTEITKATKDKNKLQKQLKETHEYDEALAHIANQNIQIDLDDGVKVNYAKFQNVEVSKEGKKSKKINLLKKL